MSQTEDSKNRKKKALDDAAQAEGKAITTETAPLDAEIKDNRRLIKEKEAELQELFKKRHELNQQRHNVDAQADDQASNSRQAREVTKILRAQKQGSDQEAINNENRRLKQENAQLRQQMQLGQNG